MNQQVDVKAAAAGAAGTLRRKRSSSEEGSTEVSLRRDGNWRRMIRVRKGNRSRTLRPRSRARDPDREIQRSEPMYGVLSIACDAAAFFAFFRRRFDGVFIYLYTSKRKTPRNTPRFDPTTTTVTVRRAGLTLAARARRQPCTARDVFARDRGVFRAAVSPAAFGDPSATRGDAFPRLLSRAPTDASRLSPRALPGVPFPWAPEGVIQDAVLDEPAALASRRRRSSARATATRACSSASRRARIGGARSRVWCAIA